MNDIIEELQQDCGYDPEGESSIDELIAYKDALEDTLARDADALDRMNAILSDPDWGVGMLEDLHEILRSTNREKIAGATWDRH
jgi:hypothetical protein